MPNIKPFSYSPFKMSLWDDWFKSFDSEIDRVVERANLNEDGSATYTMDIPGVKQEDLHVEVQENTVAIRAERKTRLGSQKYTDCFTVSDRLDLSTLTAELENGVLTINILPKVKSEDKSSARKVDVTVK